MTLTEQITAVLAEHGGRGARYCACGEPAVLRPGPLGTHKGFITWHRAHVAAHLAPLVRQAQAEALREAAAIIETFAAETYPADVFVPPSREAYAEINALLKRERGHYLDAVAADCYRRALANGARVLREVADDRIEAEA